MAVTNDFFICFAGADRQTAVELHDLLEERDADVFIATKGLRASTDWEVRLRKEIKRSRVFVVLFSEHSAAANYQLGEIDYAVELKRKGDPIRITPVILDDEAERLLHIRRFHHISLSDLGTLDAVADELMNVLNAEEDEDDDRSTSPSRALAVPARLTSGEPQRQSSPPRGAARLIPGRWQTISPTGKGRFDAVVLPSGDITATISVDTRGEDFFEGMAIRATIAAMGALRARWWEVNGRYYLQFDSFERNLLMNILRFVGSFDRDDDVNKFFQPQEIDLSQIATGVVEVGQLTCRRLGDL